jgi:hypothetical protein
VPDQAERSVEPCAGRSRALDQLRLLPGLIQLARSHPACSVPSSLLGRAGRPRRSVPGQTCRTARGCSLPVTQPPRHRTPSLAHGRERPTSPSPVNSAPSHRPRPASHPLCSGMPQMPTRVDGRIPLLHLSRPAMTPIVTSAPTYAHAQQPDFAADHNSPRGCWCRFTSTVPSPSHLSTATHTAWLAAGTCPRAPSRRAGGAGRLGTRCVMETTRGI